MTARDDYPWHAAMEDLNRHADIPSALDEIDMLRGRIEVQDETIDKLNDEVFNLRLAAVADGEDRLIGVIRWMLSADSNQFVEVDVERSLLIIDAKIELQPDELAVIEHEMGLTREVDGQTRPRLLLGSAAASASDVRVLQDPPMPTFSVGEMQRIIAPILKRLYPQNPDVVLGCEAREIAEALIQSGILFYETGGQVTP